MKSREQAANANIVAAKSWTLNNHHREGPRFRLKPLIFNKQVRHRYSHLRKQWRCSCQVGPPWLIEQDHNGLHTNLLVFLDNNDEISWSSEVETLRLSLQPVIEVILIGVVDKRGLWTNKANRRSSLSLLLIVRFFAHGKYLATVVLSSLNR